MGEAGFSRTLGSALLVLPRRVFAVVEMLQEWGGGEEARACFAGQARIIDHQTSTRSCAMLVRTLWPMGQTSMTWAAGTA